MTHAEAQYQKFREWSDSKPEWPKYWKGANGHSVRIDTIDAPPGVPSRLKVFIPSCSLPLAEARELAHWLLLQTGPCGSIYAYKPGLSPSGTITGADGREHMAGHN